MACALVACGGGPREQPIRNEGVHVPKRTKPSLDEVESTVRDLADAITFLTPSADQEAASALLATPLWFDGFSFAQSGDDALRASCTRTEGTVSSPAELRHFVECTLNVQWHMHEGDDLDEVSINDLPSVFQKHRARLSDLAADHTFAYGHFCPAAPGDYWTLYAATKDNLGHVRIDAILLSHDEDADCRQK